MCKIFFLLDPLVAWFVSLFGLVFNILSGLFGTFASFFRHPHVTYLDTHHMHTFFGPISFKPSGPAGCSAYKELNQTFLCKYKFLVLGWFYVDSRYLLFYRANKCYSQVLFHKKIFSFIPFPINAFIR